MQSKSLRRVYIIFMCHDHVKKVYYLRYGIYCRKLWDDRSNTTRAIWILRYFNGGRIMYGKYIWKIIKVAETTTSRTYFGLLLHLLLLLLLLDIILFTDHTSHPPGSITNHPNLKVTCPVHVAIYGQCKKERWNEWLDITTRFLCAKMIFYTWTVNVSHMWIYITLKFVIVVFLLLCWLLLASTALFSIGHEIYRSGLVLI